MKIGKSLYLEMRQPETNEVERFECTIVDKTKDHIFIDYPIYEKTRKTTIIPVGTKMRVSYVSDDQNVYFFPSEIISKKMLTVPTLMIPVPEKETIKKIQRREFVRVPVAVDIAVHHEDLQVAPFTTVTVDLSGGGLSFILPKNISLNREDRLNIWMVLQYENDQFEYLELKAEIVRVNEQDNAISTASAKFMSYSPKQQQAIIQFCFEKMRQARKKELS